MTGRNVNGKKESYFRSKSPTPRPCPRLSVALDAQIPIPSLVQLHLFVKTCYLKPVPCKTWTLVQFPFELEALNINRQTSEFEFESDKFENGAKGRGE